VGAAGNKFRPNWLINFPSSFVKHPPILQDVTVLLHTDLCGVPDGHTGMYVNNPGQQVHQRGIQHRQLYTNIRKIMKYLTLEVSIVYVQWKLSLFIFIFIYFYYYFIFIFIFIFNFIT